MADRQSGNIRRETRSSRNSKKKVPRSRKVNVDEFNFARHIALTDSGNVRKYAGVIVMSFLQEQSVCEFVGQRAELNSVCSKSFK